MTIYFISDLHLSPEQPHITTLFQQCLTRLKANDTLYILGDFFEAWIGDDAMGTFEKSIASQLAALSKQQIQTYFIYGNRDFLIGKRFLSLAKTQLLPDEYVVNIAGTPTLLMHGDTLCLSDKGYLRLRKIFHNPIAQFIFLRLPLKRRLSIAKKLRQSSEMRFKEHNEQLVDVTQSAVADVMKKHGVTQLIHGHTHLPGVHPFELDGKTVTRYVLGAWHETSSVIVAEDDGTLTGPL